MGKYFKYAIGEILLVMIGILLALQVNNWNETKQKRKVELKLLQELQDDLLETKEDLLTDIEKANSTLQITDSLYQLTHKEGKHSIRVSMDYIFENPLLFPKLSAYKSIQSYGVNIISNDSLRKMVTNFYELLLKRVNYAELFVKDLNENEIKLYLDENSISENHCANCNTLFEQFSNSDFRHPKYYIVQNPNEKLTHLLKEKFLVLNGLSSQYNNVYSQIDLIIETIKKDITE